MRPKVHVKVECEVKNTLTYNLLSDRSHRSVKQWCSLETHENNNFVKFIHKMTKISEKLTFIK